MRGLWPGIALLLAVVLVYGRSLGFPFQFDDGHSIVANANLRSLSEIPRFYVDPSAFSEDPTLRMYRPLLLTGLAVNHGLSGLWPWSYHAGNVLVHGLVGLVAFQVASHLLGSRRRGALAAALFALHPVHSEAVYYVSSRSESQAALFALLALWLHLRAPTALTAVGEVAAFAAGLLTKSVAVALLPLLVLHDTLVSPGAWRARTRPYIAMAVVTVSYLLMSGDLVVRAAVAGPVRGYDEQVWSQVKGVVYYAKLLFLPRGLSVDHQFQLSSSIVDPYAATSFAVLSSALWLAFRARRRRPALLFFLLWIGVVLAPASIVPLNVIVNEHRLYLAGVAFASACAWLGVAASAGSRLVVVRGLSAAVVLLGVLAWQRGTAWASAEALWLDAVKKGPTMARPWFMLGDEYVGQGRLDEARSAMTRGLERDPHFAAGYASLAQIHADREDWDAALAAAELGVARIPDDVSLWRTLAEVTRSRALAADGDPTWWRRSAEAYERAVSLTPDDIDLRGNLGNTYQELKEPRRALDHHLHAAAADPDNPEARLNLGNSYLMLERWEEAEAEYRAALEIAPDYTGAWRNLSILYARTGRHEAAARAAGRAATEGIGP